MSNQAIDQHILIGSDAPQVNPEHDAFGYAPFSKGIADAIHTIRSPRGLVMAVHGVWGSGKTSLLYFVKHYLVQLPESRRPIVIDFNLWWFKDREDLATQFLASFRNKLVGESDEISKRRMG